ncbi:MAG: hypothetical protein Ct9H90mP26_2960 [Methanobacteriota archaeon]|nr:MAG: hypothetical protein Ct9H90mP26_2960 [Euryarchaeota archaeon]
MLLSHSIPQEKGGMIENVPPSDSSNILRVTGDVKIRKALSKGKLKTTGRYYGKIYRREVQHPTFRREVGIPSA